MKRVFSIIGMMLVGVATYTLTERGPLQKADLVQLVAKSEHTTGITLVNEYRNPERQIYKVTGTVTQPLTSGQWQTLDFHNSSHLGNTLQLNIHTPTTLWLDKLIIFNRASDHYEELSAPILAKSLFIEHNASLVHLEDTRLKIETLLPNAKLTLQGSFGQTSPLLQYGLALIFAAIAYVLLRGIEVNTIAGISDIDLGTKLNPNHRAELDGLRGLAALLVLLEHTWGVFAGIGLTGVWFFFILSGYLLAQPFIAKPERATDWRFLRTYTYRRLTRILPMYSFVLIVYFAFTGHIQILVEHLLFLDAQGHFWTIPQELAFYLALPIFVLFLYGVYRLSPRASLGVLTLLCLVFLFYPQAAMIQLFGNGDYRHPLFGWFLLGVCLAGFHHTLNQSKLSLSPKTQRHASWFGLALLGALLISSTYRFSAALGETVLFPAVYRHWYGIAAAIVVACILLSNQRHLSQLFNFKPLRAIGIVAFSFYLLHPMVINLVTDFSLKFFGYQPIGGILFFTTGALTWAISLFTYTQIERPFLSLGRKKPVSS